MKNLVAVVLILAAGSALAESKDAFLKAKIDSWFAEAKTATSAVFVTDAKGCLFSLYDPGNGIQMIAMLDDEKKPLCRKPAK